MNENWEKGSISLSKEIQEELEFSHNKAKEGNMHIVNVIFIGVLSKELGHSYGYFDYITEAETYAAWKCEFYEKLKTSYLILIDGQIHKGKLLNNDKILLQSKTM